MAYSGSHSLHNRGSPETHDSTALPSIPDHEELPADRVEKTSRLEERARNSMSVHHFLQHQMSLHRPPFRYSPK